MNIVIVDSNRLERVVLSDFLSDLGFKVDALDRLSGRKHEPNDGQILPCAVILSLLGTQNHGVRQVADVAAAYPGAPIIVLADRGFCMDVQDPYIGAIHAVVRRPVQIEEIEWILWRLSKTRQT